MSLPHKTVKTPITLLIYTFLTVYPKPAKFGNKKPPNSVMKKPPKFGNDSFYHYLTYR